MTENERSRQTDRQTDTATQSETKKQQRTSRTKIPFLNTEGAR